MASAWSLKRWDTIKGRDPVPFIGDGLGSTLTINQMKKQIKGQPEEQLQETKIIEKS